MNQFIYLKDEAFEEEKISTEKVNGSEEEDEEEEEEDIPNEPETISS